MIRHIPMVTLQRGVYQVLKAHQTTPVYDDIPHGAEPPAISFGPFTASIGGAKNVDISDVTLKLDIWSHYEGKKEINEIANEVASVLTSVEIDLKSDGFRVLSQDVIFFEAFPEDEVGYHGVLTFEAKIQYIGG